MGTSERNPRLDNLFKPPEWLEAKYGEDQIAPSERAQYENGFLGLVRGAAHARYALKDYTIMVAYLQGQAVAIRYQRHTLPTEMDDYELERILAANSGGLRWHLQPKDIWKPATFVNAAYRRDDGVTATTYGRIFITFEAPAVKSFLEEQRRQQTERRHREEPTF